MMGFPGKKILVRPAKMPMMLMFMKKKSDRNLSSMTGMHLKIQTKANLTPVMAKVIMLMLEKAMFFTKILAKQTYLGNGPQNTRKVSILKETVKIKIT